MQLRSINGFTINVDPALTEEGEPYTVKRTWKERLFSKPWNPLKRDSVVIPQVPSKDVYVYDNVLYMHPQVLEEYKTQLVETNKWV